MESAGPADGARRLPPGLSDSDHPRAIRSFVTRSGRITPAQERALEELWPRYGIEPDAAPLGLDALFGRRARRVAEVGFGNGDNLLALAASRPADDFLGIEVHRPGVGRLLLQLEERAIGNVRVICRDAVEVLERYLDGPCLDEILILFPDPWPKKRHHKRRLIQPAFVALLARAAAKRRQLCGSRPIGSRMRQRCWPRCRRNRGCAMSPRRAASCRGPRSAPHAVRAAG